MSAAGDDAGRGGAPPLAERAEAAIEELRLRPTDDVVAEATRLLKELKSARAFGELTRLGETVARVRPDDPVVAGFYAQGLIETGACVSAIAVLERALRGTADGTPEADELSGLRGRAHKQIFMNSLDHSQPEAARAIEQAVAAYRVPFEHRPANYWHGINLAACLYAARRRKLDPAPDLTPQEVARKVLGVLGAIPADKRDPWWWATKAEAHVALGEWDDAEKACGEYVRDPTTPPFNFASTIRQFREVWEIQKDGPRGETLMQLLDAALVAREDGVLSVSPQHVRSMRAADAPTTDQAEKVLGDTDAVTLRWYRRGLERAAAVASIRSKQSGGRFGTGFAVRAGDFGITPAEATLVLTNHHVVNANGEEGAERPQNAEIEFEAAEGAARGPFAVIRVLSESPFEDLDYALLEVDGDLSGIPAVPVHEELPPLAEGPRVYVIGHPRGDELHISFQDNRLLDHEAPPDGKPPVPGRCRVHYHAPTSPGSSGSPVFDAGWGLIALHHAGAKYDPQSSLMGLKRLNSQPGRYSANEGLWIMSIIEDVSRKGIRLAQHREPSGGSHG